MRVLKTNFYDSPNIGMYCYCCNSYCLVPHGVIEKYGKEISEVLNVPVYEISVAGTPLIGVFLAGNDNCLLVPEIMFKYERAVLEKNNIKYEVIKTKNTALGNNICANNNGAIIGHDFEPAAVKKISEALGVPVKKATIGGMDIVGSVCVANDRTAIAHNNITDKEKAAAESLLKAKILPVTIDSNPHVRAGIIVNNSGYLVTENIKTKEIILIDQTLNE